MSFRTLNQQAAQLKALGHPKRLEILSLLHNRTLSASEIEDMTGFPQANLSQHLHILKTAKVIVADRKGKQIWYRLAHPDFIRITKVLEGIDSKPPSHTHMFMVKDPVCGMDISPAAAHFSTIYKGATYFFCASGCEKKFLRVPERYV